MLRSIRRFIEEYWQPFIVGVSILLLLSGILLYRLTTLAPQLTISQITFAHQSQSFFLIGHNPIYLPLKLVAYGLFKVGLRSIFTIRYIGVFVAFLSVICFYSVLKIYYSRHTTILGTTLYATSSWFLHSARGGNSDVLLLVLIIFLVAIVLTHRTKRRSFFIITSLLSTLFLFYVPGLIWFIPILVIWQHKYIAHMLRRLPIWVFLISICIIAIGITPLIVGIYLQPSLIYACLGLPSQWSSVLSLANNLKSIPVQIFWHAKFNPTSWLDQLAFLDIFSAVMFILGLYSLWQSRRTDFSKAIVGALIISILLISADGAITLTLLIPLVYIVIAMGIAYMLQQWFKVFPFNPIARSIGVGLMVVAVSFVCYYQLQSYFIAWPHSPNTIQAFDKQS